MTPDTDISALLSKISPEQKEKCGKLLEQYAECVKKGNASASVNTEGHSTRLRGG